MEKQNNFKNVVSFINNAQKSELIERLVSFVCGDTILYLPENQSAKKYLSAANEFLCTDFQMCDDFSTADINVLQKDKIKDYLAKLKISKLAGLYLAATELRSVLLAVLLAEGKLNIEETFDCSFAEELAEQKKWGTFDEIRQKHKEIKERLQKAEKMINA